MLSAQLISFAHLSFPLSFSSALCLTHTCTQLNDWNKMADWNKWPVIAVHIPQGPNTIGFSHAHNTNVNSNRNNDRMKTKHTNKHTSKRCLMYTYQHTRICVMLSLWRSLPLSISSTLSLTHTCTQLNDWNKMTDWNKWREEVHALRSV